MEENRQLFLKRRRFKAGQRLKDSFGRIYLVDQSGAFRREDGGNHRLTKAEKKAARRERTAKAVAAK